MANPWSGREPGIPPTAYPPAAPTPVDPWAGAAYVSEVPTPTSTFFAAPPRRRRRRWLGPMAAGTAVLAVVVFAVVAFWPAGEGSQAPLGFHPVTEAGQVEFSEDADPSLVHFADDHVYAAATVGPGLEVVARDITSGTESWRTTLAGQDGQSWEWLAANSSVVLVVAAAARSVARPVVALDVTTGQRRWEREVVGDVIIFLRDRVVVLAGEEFGLQGLDPRNGHVLWETPFSSDEQVRALAVVTVELSADYAHAGEYDGAPVHRRGNGVVVVNGDRSARLLDLATGEYTWQHSNVADPTDLFAAQDNWLYVAEDTEGYRLLAYDLTTTTAPRTLYPVEDTTRRPITRPVPCGSERICLLDRSGSDPASVELVAVDSGGGQGQAWRRPVPGASQLLAVGDMVVASGGDPAVAVFDRDGELVVEQATGLAVRINEGNMLLFGDAPTAFSADLSLLGYAVADRELVALHTVRQVRSSACAWGLVDRSAYLACPTRDTVTIWRFASG